jgi:hypothetical protein
VIFVNRIDKAIVKICKADNEAAEAFLHEYDDCRNVVGDKVSPLVIVYKKDMDQIMNMNSGKEISDFVASEITRLNNEAHEAGVPSSAFDYVGKWLDKMQVIMPKKSKNKAIEYLSNAVLSGDGMAVCADKEEKK